MKSLKSIVIDTPTHIDIPRKTKKARRMYLNLNGYRNWHFVVSNQLKHAYKNIIAQQMVGVIKGKFTGPVKISYQIFYKDNRRHDKGNVLSIVQKFFLDAIVELGYLPDDADKYITQETFLKPIIDKSLEAGKVRITIELDEEQAI